MASHVPTNGNVLATVVHGDSVPTPMSAALIPTAARVNTVVTPFPVNAAVKPLKLTARPVPKQTSVRPGAAPGGFVPTPMSAVPTRIVPPVSIAVIRYPGSVVVKASNHMVRPVQMLTNVQQVVVPGASVLMPMNVEVITIVSQANTVATLSQVNGNAKTCYQRVRPVPRVLSALPGNVHG